MERAGSLQDARSFAQAFFAWYDGGHQHSGLGLLPPDGVHRGASGAVIGRRRALPIRHMPPEPVAVSINTADVVNNRWAVVPSNAGPPSNLREPSKRRKKSPENLASSALTLQAPSHRLAAISVASCVRIAGGVRIHTHAQRRSGGFVEPPDNEFRLYDGWARQGGG
jgi:hypothetical protein